MVKDRPSGVRCLVRLAHVWPLLAVTRFVRPSGTKRRRQAVLGDLLEQRLVADLEHPRGLGTVPAHASEHFQERFALGLSRPAAPSQRGVVFKRSVLAGWSWRTPSRATSMHPLRNSR